MHFTGEATKTIHKKVKLLSSRPSSSHHTWRHLQYQCTFSPALNNVTYLSAALLKSREVLLRSAKAWISATLRNNTLSRQSLSPEMFHASILLYNINAQFLPKLDFLHLLSAAIETFPSLTLEVKKNYEWSLWRTLASFLQNNVGKCLHSHV